LRRVVANLLDNAITHSPPGSPIEVRVSVEDGEFRLQVTPNNIGAGYLIRVRAGQSQTELLLETPVNEWGWYQASQARNTPRPLRPAPVTIEGPAHIDISKPVKLTFESPYRGRVLLTAETHEVLAREWKDVKAGKNEWTFTVAGFVPNVFVSALIIKDPHLESEDSFLPERAFGVKSFPIKPTEYTGKLRVSAPSEVRSRSPLRVELDTGPTDEPTFATVAVVDEGVLSLTRFKTPNPLDSIFARRALGVDTFETVGWALRLPTAGTGSLPGGGDDYDEDGPGSGDALGRIMPVRPVALWSGVLEVPPNGKLNVDFNLPLYRGKVRVMAVTMGKKKVGSAEAEVLVRDPLTIQTTLPRFMVPHDEAEIPVFITNLSDGPREVTVSIRAEVVDAGGLSAAASSGPPLRIKGRHERITRIEKGASQTVVFPIRALHQAGAARLRVSARSGQEEVWDEALIPFVPPGPRERQVRRIELVKGGNDLTDHLQGWIPTSERSNLWVTTNPHTESFEHLRFLVRYPYGCLEQTTSTMRPLLFASQFLGQVDPSFAPGDGEFGRIIRAGIDRILSMRHTGGGFAFWPGGGYVDAWSTAYATHFLFDADRLGYTLPNGVLDEALKYLESNLSTGRASHYGDAEPYAHYVLALAGKGRKARLSQLVNQLPAAPQGRQAETAYMLKAALYLTGDRRYEDDLKAVDTSPMGTSRETGYPFYSDLRYRGFVLNIFFDLFGNDPAGNRLAEQVAEGLKGQRSTYYTTQELAWATTGLGKWYRGLATSFEGPTLVANGRPMEPTVSAAGSDRSWAIARASEYETLVLEVAVTPERP
ncbi:MAG: alpha-2-macroglobulin family protein, partial [Bradymonadaceae bacterium]